MSQRITSPTRRLVMQLSRLQMQPPRPLQFGTSTATDILFVRTQTNSDKCCVLQQATKNVHKQKTTVRTRTLTLDALRFIHQTHLGEGEEEADASGQLERLVHVFAHDEPARVLARTRQLRRVAVRCLRHATRRLDRRAILILILAAIQLKKMYIYFSLIFMPTLMETPHDTLFVVKDQQRPSLKILKLEPFSLGFLTNNALRIHCAFSTTHIVARWVTHQIGFAQEEVLPLEPAAVQLFLNLRNTQNHTIRQNENDSWRELLAETFFNFFLQCGVPKRSPLHPTPRLQKSRCGQNSEEGSRPEWLYLCC